MKLVKLWEADLIKAYELQNSFIADENGFVNNVVGCSLDEFKDYVIEKEGYSRGVGLPEGYVPDTTFILANDDGQYVGIFNLRHCLNDFLANNAGHIGYGIRSDYRGKGYATEGLNLVIEQAWKIIPEEEIYMSVHKDNPSSLRVMIKNGAFVHHEDEKQYYTRIKKNYEFNEEVLNMQYGPNPNAVYPNEAIRSVCFIKNIITRPNIMVGEYSYYDDVNGAEKFEEHVTHHYEFIGDKLIIGKFCAIAKGIEFVMNGANHRMNSITTYPFNIMGGGWEKCTPTLEDLPYKGDTVIGNDVWIGQNVTVMPGVHIGDGAIIGANSVVTKDIPAYHIAGGNPCKIIRKRFDDELISYLQKLKWWDWSPEKIFRNLEILCSGDLEQIRNISAPNINLMK